MTYYFKIKWLPQALLVLGLLFGCNMVKAQDTVSTSGIQFRASTPDIPAKVIKKAAVVKVVKSVDTKQEKRTLWAI